jgi:hypothetical protein
MAVISLGMTAIGGGISAYGSMQQGAASQSMYNYQAQVATINSEIEQNNARYAQSAGDIQAQGEGIKGATTVGQTRAAIGAGGLDIGSGSAKQVQQSETEVTQFDEATIRNDAARRAYGYNVAAFSDTAQSTLDVAAGKESATAGDIGAYASLLGTAGSVDSKWVNFQKTGILS